MRPKKNRCIRCELTATVYKPRGVPTCELELVVLEADELEALRLADVERLHHEEAGSRMGVSRATFGRILESARGKTARALIGQHAIELRAADEPE
ncbi:MAG: DUF134 domain-containing protein [Verrucomicrobiota bacterium JB024]|nr:DUF134 domain-containing protein [Verrucomicrobiota bacterium JB024]